VREAGGNLGLPPGEGEASMAVAACVERSCSAHGSFASRPRFSRRLRLIQTKPKSCQITTRPARTFLRILPQPPPRPPARRPQRPPDLSVPAVVLASRAASAATRLPPPPPPPPRAAITNRPRSKWLSFSESIRIRSPLGRPRRPRRPFRLRLRLPRPLQLRRLLPPRPPPRRLSRWLPLLRLRLPRQSRRRLPWSPPRRPPPPRKRLSSRFCPRRKRSVLRRAGTAIPAPRRRPRRVAVRTVRSSVPSVRLRPPPPSASRRRLNRVPAKAVATVAVRARIAPRVAAANANPVRLPRRLRPRDRRSPRSVPRRPKPSPAVSSAG
jgi:hypothetical protein